MACCDLKQGTGKCLVFLFTFIFGAGVIISTLSPNWIHFTVQDAQDQFKTTQVEYGPFYGQIRTCDETLSTCGSWESKSIDLSDCESIQDGAEEKLCNHLNTWRITGILSLIAVLIGGGLVFAASCCQMVTCGCCGNSMTCLSNVLFWIEVILSIVTWAFTISSLNLVKDGSTMVSDSGYQWGFWLYILCGTIIGALSAWMADWAAEDSCLRGVWHCILCKHCRKKSNDEKAEPLIPGESL